MVEIRVKLSQPQTMEYSESELSRILEVIDGRADELLRLRNRALITVLLNSAVRLSELLTMKVSDVHESGKTKIVGKGGKHRVVTVGTSGLDAIRMYLDARGDREGCLWQTEAGSALTPEGLRSLFARIERTLSDRVPEGVYAHRFRHTAITRLLRAKVPLRSVQRYAGHSDPQTTLRYAQALDADEAIAAIDRLDGGLWPHTTNV